MAPKGVQRRRETSQFQLILRDGNWVSSDGSFRYRRSVLNTAVRYLALYLSGLDDRNTAFSQVPAGRFDFACVTA